MHQVFISYSTIDSAVADAVCYYLECGNIRCWYAPRDVQAGISWAGQLMRAIRESKIFLLIYSKNFNQSPQVISELTEAVEAGCIIVPFRIDQTPMNDDLAFYLKKVHWLDAMNPPTAQHVDNLYTHLVRILQMSYTQSAYAAPNDCTTQLGYPTQYDYQETYEYQEQYEYIPQYEYSQQSEYPSQTKSLFSRLLPIILASAALLIGIVCAICFWPSPTPIPDNPPATTEPQIFYTTEPSLEMVFTEPTISTQPQETTEPIPETTPEPEYQKINFVNLSRLPKYTYPFLSRYMMSQDSAFIMLQNSETKKFTLGRTDNGAVYISNIELNCTNLTQLEMMLSNDYNTVYFTDTSENMVYIFDRSRKEWINQQGIHLGLSDTEVIYTSGWFSQNMRSSNSHLEQLTLFVYDTAPELQCISRIMQVLPSGELTSSDISEHRIVSLVAGIDSPGFEGILFMDSSNNFRVYDDSTGNILDLDYEEILQDYIPYIEHYGTFSEDHQYYLSNQSNCTQVWNLHTGSHDYSRIFTDFVSVYFSGPQEIIVYNDENQSVFLHDLETGRETVLLDKEYFKNHPQFMDIIMQFCYSEKYDVCIFVTADYFDEETQQGSLRVNITDRSGKILASSDLLTTSNGSHYTFLTLTDNMLFLEADLVEWDTAKPEDGIVTEMFRAEFSVDDEGNLVFQ